MSGKVRETAAAVVRFWEAERRAPTIREVGDALGLSSSHTAHRRLRAAAAAGLIEVGEGQRFAPRPIGACPLCGSQTSAPGEASAQSEGIPA